jgi:TPR repeat protein
VPFPWRHTLCTGALLALTACALQPRAMLGSAEAQYRLGLEYLVAEPPDYAKAAYWLRRAAIQGDKQAQKQLGRFYAIGWDGGEPSPVQAYLWLELAAVLDPEANDERQVLARHMSKQQIESAQALAAQYQRGQAPDAELEAARLKAVATAAAAKPSTPAQPPKSGARAQGYDVRLGLFASRANADKLLTRLRALGEPAIREPLRRNGRELILVRAGRYPDAKTARAAQKRIKTELGVDSVITMAPPAATAPPSSPPTQPPKPHSS